MTESELDAIEARANAATPGPWYDFSIANSRADIPALIAEVRRLKAEAAKTVLEGLSVQALVARIAELETENARFKSLIEQSANEWTWLVDDTWMYLIGPNSSGPRYRKIRGRWVHVYDDSIAFDDPAVARAWTENKHRENGHMKPIDIIHVRPRDVEAGQ